MRSLTCRRVGAAAAVLAAAAVGCGGGGDGGGGGVTPPSAAITVSLSAGSLTVMQGQSGTVTMTVTRMNGFAGDVDLTIEGAPSGVTATCTPWKIPSGSASASLELAVGPTVAAGTYTMTVRGRGAGVADHTVTLSLTVGVAGSYTLSVSPASVTIQQGATGAATVTIQRSGGFAGAVALTVSGMPAGMTVVASPTTLTGAGASASLTITAATNTAVGGYPLTVHGSTAGLSEQTATIAVQVASTAGTSVTMKFCGADIPMWFAVQSDGGPWTQVTGGPGGYTFSVGAKGAEAFVMGSSDYPATAVIFASAAELVEIGQATVANCANPAYGSRRLNGTVANLGASQVASISIGDGYASVSGNGPMTFTVDHVPDAAADLIAVRQNVTETGFIPDKLIARRGVNLPNGATIPLLDFAAAEAFAPAMANLTLSNLGADSAIAVAGIYAGMNTFASISETYGTTQLSFGGLPANQLVSSDVHELAAISVAPGGANDARGVDAYFHAVADQTFTLGPALATPTFSTVSATTPQRWRAQLAVQSAYPNDVSVDFSQSLGFGSSRGVTLYATAAYLGGSPSTWDVTIPDMSAAGYNAAWGLAAGTAVSWMVSATNFPKLTEVGGPLPNAGQYVFAIRSSADATLIALHAVPRRPSFVRVLRPRMSRFAVPVRPRR